MNANKKSISYSRSFAFIRGYYLIALLLLCPSCHRKKTAVAYVEAEDRPAPVTEIAIADPSYSSRLLRGFYEGTTAWKWTGQNFAVSLDPPEPPQRTALVLDLTVPEELLAEVKTVTLSATANGIPVGKTEYRKTGRFNFGHELPAKALQRKPVEIDFSLDKAARWPDGRPLGIVAVNVSLQPLEDNPVTREMSVRMARAGYQKLLQERDSRLPLEKQHEMMKLFHDIPIWQHMRFHNVEIAKNPLDLWMMQQIIYQVQPDFVVETGTWRGGSALYWAHTLNGMALENSRVITMDIQDLTQTAATHPLWKKYVTFLRGSSTDPRIVSEIARMVQGRKVLVTLDSDHSMRHVLDELHAYAPMVSPRSYLVVEDTHIDGVPTQPGFGPGPLSAVQQFLAEGGSKDFEQDLTREAYIMTFNPGGWLRRK